MVALGFVWLALLVIELAYGLSPPLEGIGLAIWVVFIIDFLLRFILAPHKRQYLRRNWLTLIALAVPALRVFRFMWVVRLLRYTRSLRLVRLVASLNRGLAVLRRTMSRRGLGYVALFTLIVTVAGAAGMYAFEVMPSGRGFNSYSEALWWTAMIITTLGSDYWPKAPEGRLLCLLLSVYAVGVFGYFAASLASFFIGRDSRTNEQKDEQMRVLEEMRREVAALREEVRALRQPYGRDQGSA
jgi:voltage-gated potassium channel